MKNATKNPAKNTAAKSVRRGASYELDRPKSAPRLTATEQVRVDVARAIGAAKRLPTCSWDSIIFHLLGIEEVYPAVNGERRFKLTHYRAWQG